MLKCRVIDADAHFIEPESMWPQYLDARHQAIAPRSVRDSMGRDRLLIGDQIFPPNRVVYDDTPASRLKAMEAEGIESMMLYPTLGLFFGGLQKVEVWAPLCRAYNNWARDYCNAAPSRLMFPALLPQLSVEACMEEARRAVTELGCKGVFLRPNPIANRQFDHPAWEPFWNLLEELDTPLVLHEGTTPYMPQVGSDRFESYVFLHAVSHPFEHMMAMLALVCGGVLERHPKLRVLHVEAGCGWLPFWMERMDHHVDRPVGDLLKLKEKPSDYVRRQCLVSADPEENIIAQVVSAVGDDVIAFSTDFPHFDHVFEGMVAKCANTPGLSDASKAKIMGGNVARMFRI
jgi:predicted TIM-barrel fold metal-dependent hydrolase